MSTVPTASCSVTHAPATPHPSAPWWAAALCAALLTACGSIPVSSLWKMRNLQFETLDPAALRAAAVHSGAVALHGPSLVLSVSVSRTVRLPGGDTVTETLAEKLPLQELRSTAERSALADYERPRTVVQVWRIDPAALPRLHALRATALAWKKLPNDHGKRELSLGLELAGCQRADAGSRAVTTLMRFTEQSEYIPIVRGIDLADTMPAAEWKKRFPDCGPR